MSVAPDYHVRNCRHSPACNPLNCRRPFDCGTLRYSKYSTSEPGWLWVLLFFYVAIVVAIGMIAVAIALIILDQTIWSTLSWLGLVAWLAIAIAPAYPLFHYYRTWTLRMAQNFGHVGRALQLNRYGCHPLPRATSDLAFPVVHPGVADVGVELGGSINGDLIYVLQYEYTWRVYDYGFRPFNELARALAIVRNRGYEPIVSYVVLMVEFPDPLDFVPDFVMIPNRRSIELTEMQRRFGGVRCKIESNERDARRFDREYQLFCADPKQLSSDLLALLVGIFAQQPGWNVQVLAGRLHIWRGKDNPTSSWFRPYSIEQINGLINFACGIRRRLV